MTSSIITFRRRALCFEPALTLILINFFVSGLTFSKKYREKMKILKQYMITCSLDLKKYFWHKFFKDNSKNKSFYLTGKNFKSLNSVIVVWTRAHVNIMWLYSEMKRLEIFFLYCESRSFLTKFFDLNYSGLISKGIVSVKTLLKLEFWHKFHF